MEKTVEYIKITIAALGTGFTWLFGAWDTAIAVLIFFMIADYVSGVICGYINKELSSDVGLKGISRKFLILLVLMSAFMVYDDSVIERPKYFVRTYVDHNDFFRGDLYTETHIRTFFFASGNVMWEKEKLHGFDGVPATEFIENKERIGSLHSIMPMITDVTDEDVRMAFGIAPQYKLQGMVNLIKTKQRKFMLGMDRRYKLIFSNPVSDMKKDDWMKIRYRFLV